MPEASLSPLVLVADNHSRRIDTITPLTTDLEKIDSHYRTHLIEQFSKISTRVSAYQHPSEFVDRICHHKNDIVFSCWHGENSRNRMSLMPAICEAYDVRYVGGDAYAKFLCQDKQLSKELARRCGLPSANGVAISTAAELDAIDFVALPHVIKPSREGTSVGISDNSLSHSHKASKRLCKEFLNAFKQPILVEEFVSGRECLICIVGSKTRIRLFGAAELYIESDPEYFKSHVFGYELKKQGSLPLRYRSVTHELTQDDKTACINVFRALGKIEALRIDVRIVEGRIKMIELSPTPYFSRDSAYACVFGENGLSLTDGIRLVFENTIDCYQQTETSGLER